MMTMRSLLLIRDVMSHLLRDCAGASGVRADGRSWDFTCRAGARADQIELVGAGHDLAADRPLQRLPEDPILADCRERVGGRDRSSVRADARRLDDPAVAVARHQSLGEAAPVVEDPHPELLPLRIPADALGAAKRDAPLDLDVELAEQEVAVIRPSAARLDDPVVALVDPLAEHPLELLQSLVRIVLGRLVADQRVEPAAALAGVDHAIPVGARRRLRPGRERRRTLLDGEIRPEEPQGVGVHAETCRRRSP